MHRRTCIGVGEVARVVVFKGSSRTWTKISMFSYDGDEILCFFFSKLALLKYKFI